MGWVGRNDAVSEYRKVKHRDSCKVLAGRGISADLKAIGEGGRGRAPVERSAFGGRCAVRNPATPVEIAALYRSMR